MKPAAMSLREIKGQPPLEGPLAALSTMLRNVASDGPDELPSIDVEAKVDDVDEAEADVELEESNEIKPPKLTTGGRNGEGESKGDTVPSELDE